MSARLRPLPYREVKRRLEAAGFIETIVRRWGEPHLGPSADYEAAHFCKSIPASATPRPDPSSSPGPLP